MADDYLLRVTAGPTYNPSTHQIVNVNTPESTYVSSPHCKAAISVRIQNYRGLPSTSPPTSPYFAHPPHAYDQYSISLSFLLPPSAPAIPGPSLLFGNDFDHPIRDRIPPGFSTAFRIVKWAIDPGLDGDVYADKPYLYGRAGGSWNVLRVGEKIAEGTGDGKGEAGKRKDESEEEVLQALAAGEEALEEGGDGSGTALRKEKGIPEGAEARKKWFLREDSDWEWEGGRVYQADFHNGYLDFNTFALNLPGFSLSILPYLGGEDHLRYVLKNKDTDQVLFVIVFTLLKKEDIDKEEVQTVEKTQAEAEAAKQEGESRQEGDFVGGGDDDVD